MLVFHFMTLNMAVAAPSKQKMKITKNDPVLVTSPQESIPVERKEGGETFISKNKWWILFGLVAAGGAAALAAGGGSSDKNSSNDDTNINNGGDTGSVTVSWQN